MSIFTCILAIFVDIYQMISQGPGINFCIVIASEFWTIYFVVRINSCPVNFAFVQYFSICELQSKFSYLFYKLLRNINLLFLFICLVSFLRTSRRFVIVCDWKLNKIFRDVTRGPKLIGPVSSNRFRVNSSPMSHRTMTWSDFDGLTFG